MKKIVLAGLGGCFFAFSTAGYGDFMDLDQAVAYALEHNPQLAAAAQQTRASNAAEQAVAGQRLPSVDLSYSTQRSNNPLDAFASKLNTGSVNPATDFSPEALNDPAPSTLHATQLSVSLPVYTGGRIDASMRAAEANTHSAEFSQERLGRFTVFQVRKNYREAQASTERVVIATAAAEAASNHVATTSRLVRQGRIITSDKLTAEVNLAAVNAALEQARTQSRLAFNQLTT
ncbi:MAG: TolC family protein, partial [Gammaproteobacteria bacterium]|nr:TolC family protein [Gammaproteobacteria bacterium]